MIACIDNSADEDEPTELEKALARPEDTPAPLFVRKESATQNDEINVAGQPESELSQDIDQSIATIQGQEAPSNSEQQPFESEADGTPVVGDWLKIQFVEHQVVPTILVGFRYCISAVAC